MKVDVLLRTRDFDTDYRWVFRPDYVDQVMEEKMSFLIQMMQKFELKEFLTEESLHNIYYIYDENGSVLVRSGFSGSMDSQGRTIYAVEGLACPPEQNRIFWYALPYLIDRLSGNTLLRDRWMPGRKGTHQTTSRQLSFDTLTEECLFMEPGETGSMWQQMQDHSECMKKLMQDIQTSPDMFSFVYGTRGSSFYPCSVGSCYTPGELETLPVIHERQINTALHPVISEENETYRIEIQIEPQGKRYGAFLLARDGQGEAVAETDKMTFGKDGIDLAQIEKARIALDKKLVSVGYNRGRRKER